MNPLLIYIGIAALLATVAPGRPAAATREPAQTPTLQTPPAPAEDLRPLSELLDEVAARFGVQFRCKNFAADTVAVRYGASRIRPYSLEQTLDNLLQPLDLKWSGTTKITVQPFEFHRRTPADGEQLLAWLGRYAADRATWEARRDTLLSGVRAALALEPFEAALAAHPTVRLGQVVRHNGYTTCNYALETLPGLYVCGTIYAPADRRKHALVMAPCGHWEGARYRPDQQLLMATLARMGAVAVDMDIVGWGESELQIGREAHTADYAMQLQVLWSKCVTDWILRTRSDIDPARIAATGGSGGATHALMLAVVEPRISCLAPVVHLVSHFDGGCPCENGRPVTLAAGGSCMPEILAAAMAPRPVLTVSDGGDWTASYPTLEAPYLRRIWSLYGAADRLCGSHFADERHDFGANKRRAVYDFFAAELGLDAAKADESQVELLPEAALQSFGAAWPAGAIRSQGALEEQIARLREAAGEAR